jgi:hypothetical protein
LHIQHKMLYAGASDRWGIDIMENVAALNAHREGKLALPPGYALEYGADVLLLRREGGSVVAAFTAKGTTSTEVERTAWNDHRQGSRDTA